MTGDRRQATVDRRRTRLPSPVPRLPSPVSPLPSPVQGDCVSCNRCVQVCPTGIDIRQGLQMECIGCAACVDACDTIMDKLQRPRGLIRYSSLNGLMGKRTKLIRPRIILYIVLMAMGAVAMTVSLSTLRPVTVTVT